MGCVLPRRGDPCGRPPSHRTTVPSVGATLAVARPTAPHASPRVIAKPVRTLAVAIRNPNPRA